MFVNNVPDIMVDEPWYGNTAYNFSKGNGIVNTSPGSQGGDIFIIYTVLLGSFYKLFGCTLLVTRTFSIISGVFALIGLIEVLKLLRIKLSVIALVSGLFIFSNVFYIIFRSGRPDGLIVTFGIWSVYFVIKHYFSGKMKDLLLSSVMGCLAAGVHPHGFLFLAATGIFFIFISIERKKLKPLWNFTWITGIVMLIQMGLVYSIIGERINDVLWQFKERNTFGNNQSILQNLLIFLRDYTLGIKRLYILIFEVGIILLALVYFKKESVPFRSLVTSAIFIFFFSIIIFNPYPMRHFGEFAIFSLMILALMLNSATKTPKQTLYVASILYFLNIVAGDLYIIIHKARNESYDLISKEIDKAVPDKTVAVSMLEFWFPLKENTNYNQYTRWHKTPYNNVDELIASDNIQYAVISDYMISGVTGTSGRQKPVKPKDQYFFKKITEVINRKGVLEKELPTKNYGLIQIWKIKN